MGKKAKQYVLSFVLLDSLQNEIIRMQNYTTLEYQTCIRILLLMGIKHYEYNEDVFFEEFRKHRYKSISRNKNNLSYRNKAYSNEKKADDDYLEPDGDHHGYYRYSISINSEMHDLLKKITYKANEKYLTRKKPFTLSETVTRVIRLELDDIFEKYDFKYSHDIKRNNEKCERKITINKHIDEVLEVLSTEAGTTVNAMIKYIILKYLVEHDTLLFNDTEIFATNSLRQYQGRLF